MSTTNLPVPIAAVQHTYAMPIIRNIEHQQGQVNYVTRHSGRRDVTEAQLVERSCFTTAPNTFTKFLMRQLLRKHSISTIIGSTLANSCQRAHNTVCRDTDTLPDRPDVFDVEKQVLTGLVNRETSMDALYVDMYRAVMARTYEDELDTDTVSGKVVTKLLNNTRYEELLAKVNGNPALASIFAAKLMQSNRETIADIYAEQFKTGTQEQQQQSAGSAGKDLDTLTVQSLDSIADAFSNIVDFADRCTITDTSSDKEDLCNVEAFGRCIDQLLEQETSDKFSVRTTNTVNIGKFVDCLGNVDAHFARAVTSTQVGDGEEVEIEQGSNLFAAIPSEFAAFASEETELLFFSHLAEGRILQANRYGIDEGGKGPMIIMVDRSGSTNSKVTFNGETYDACTLFKAIGAAIFKYAVRWQRPAILLPFNDTVSESMRVIYNPTGLGKQESLQAQLMNYGAYKQAGGTQWIRSLEDADAWLKSAHAGLYDNADIVYITDGGAELPLCINGAYDPIYEETIRSVRRIKQIMPERVSIYGLLVDPSYATAKTAADAVNGLSYFFDEIVACPATQLSQGIADLCHKLVAGSFYSYKGAEQ